METHLKKTEGQSKKNQQKNKKAKSKLINKVGDSLPDTNVQVEPDEL